MGEPRMICELPLASVEYRWSEATTREPGNVFRIAFRRTSGTQICRFDIDRAEARQFVLSLSAIAAAMTAQLESENPQDSKR